MNPKRMLNPVRPYAWGSRHFIAALQGRPVPTASPEAELWLGAHPAAPSAVVSLPAETDAEHEPPTPSTALPVALTLDRWIAENRAETLGADVAARFGGELPFLMKILAAAQPLSLQAHPSRADAERGFNAEEAAHVPIDAPERSYKDRHHKPELIVALTPFIALCGFRPVVETRRLLAELGVGALEPCQRLLDREPPEEALRAVFQHLLGLPAAEQRHLTEAVRRGISRGAVAAAAEYASELAWTERLADLYPGDVGVVGALFLNLVHLAPGEGLYLPAGNLHAYLEGAGVEIMANSDNVLRGGLTPKPIHVAELLRILRFEETRPIPLRPTPIDAGEAVFETPADEFQLSRLQLGVGHPPVERVPVGPEVLLVTDGEVELGWGSDTVRLSRGGSVFVPSSSPPYRLSGRGSVYRARVPAAS
jgi:mannose-6-phosphate isomerase